MIGIAEKDLIHWIIISVFKNIFFLLQGFGKQRLKNLAPDISVRCTFNPTTGQDSTPKESFGQRLPVRCT